MLGEGGDGVEGARALGLLTPGVVGHRLVERGGQVGVLAHQLVVDGHRIGHAREAAGARRAQAEQAHQIRTVGVVVERDAAELVAAHGRVVDRLALIRHVAQHVAVLVLGPGLAEVQADAPVEEGEVVVAVAVGVERGDAHEAAAVRAGRRRRPGACRPARRAGSRPGRGRAGPCSWPWPWPARRPARPGPPRSGATSTTRDRPRRPPATRRPARARAASSCSSVLLLRQAAAVSRPPRTRRPGSAPVASPSRIGDGARHHRGPVAPGTLEQALAAGGEVVAHDRRLAGQMVEVDDVEVRLHAAGDHAPDRAARPPAPCCSSAARPPGPRAGARARGRGPSARGSTSGSWHRR